MTDREILINLIENALWQPVPIADIMGVADCLLERGVIVPLVNENDTVYVILLDKVIPFDIISVNLFQNHLIYKGQHGLNVSYTFRTDDIGKAYFLPVKKLKRR